MKPIATLAQNVRILTVAVVLGGIATLPVASADDFDPKVVDTSFASAYIPDGFDTNDQSQMVGEGFFPNSCYRPSMVEVAVDHTARKIYVQPSAYKYDGVCLQMIIPFEREINFGLLKAGGYEVVQTKTRTTMGMINVRVAPSSNADDYLYAPISQAYFDQSTGKKMVRLTGTFTNSCARLVDTMVAVQPKVIVVQPISELVENQNCRSGEFPFVKDVEVPSTAKAGRYLLHVRSLNGNAINSLVDLF